VQVEESLHATKNIKDQNDSENLTYANEKTNRSRLKNSRINPKITILFILKPSNIKIIESYYF